MIGFDTEWQPYPGNLVLQDVRTLHGSQFRNAAVIVASPPCQAYSYRAMPWKRAKALPPPSTELFDACFRIQKEACKAAGRHIPMVVENVKGAQPWVGRAKWHYGSYYLWGDVPALMPFAMGRKGANPIGTQAPKGTGSSSWFFGTRADPRDMRRNEDGEYTRFGQKNNGGSWFAVAYNAVSGHSKNPVNDGVKRPGINLERDGMNNYPKLADGMRVTPDGRRFTKRAEARKHASAVIAKIPFPLARHIAAVYRENQ